MFAQETLEQLVVLHLLRCVLYLLMNWVIHKVLSDCLMIRTSPCLIKDLELAIGCRCLLVVLDGLHLSLTFTRGDE